MADLSEFKLTILQSFKEQKAYKFIISLILISLASWIQYYLYPLIGPAPYLLFYPAVILSCLYGDGLTAIISSVFMTQYIFIEPIFTFKLSLSDSLRIVLYLIATLMLKKLVHILTIEKLKAEAAVSLIKEREKSLEEEREAREKFVSTLNHDLQNPLTTIRLTAEMALRKADQKEEVKKNLTKQLQTTYRMERMINNLLDANKIRAGGEITLDIKEYNLAEIITQTVEDLKQIYGNRFKLREIEAVKGHWDAEAIRRILENLCSNAVKYGSHDTAITIKTLISNDNILILVNNKGPTIDEKEMDNLFKPFHRLSSKQSNKGWGLGLALVKGLAEAHGGSIDVISNTVNGTTFTVYLPQDSRKFQKQS